MTRRVEQELAAACQYEPLPSLPEAELPDLAGIGESCEWAAVDNLDAFFTRVYRYWQDKGLLTILAGRLLNLAALAFTICFSGALLLGVDWRALRDSDCLLPHDPHRSCDLLDAALRRRPWAAPAPLAALAGAYLALCSAYWAWGAATLVAELRDVLEVKAFVNNKLGISDRQVRMMTWSELLHRLVLVQRTTRLCAARDLDELDVVGRIMRRDNYLIGMLNAGVLALYVPGPLGRLLGGGRRLLLTKTLEWNLGAVVLDAMFDEHFHVRQDFLADERRLRRRLVAAAALNAALSPFLLVFLAVYFFMKHAERFYHSPGSLGSRRWSSLARWRLREFNELPHYVQHRLDSSHEAAAKYVAQFPSPLVSQVSKFVSFVAGSFAALLLGLSLLDENLLEVPLAGRNVVWWLALTGVVLTVSRSFISDAPVAFDPERAMAELALHTHYLPRHWRGRAHSAEVQQAVSGLFTFKVLLFLEELASVVLTPFILAYSLPRCAGAILQFVSDHTVRVEGVGDVCSLAAFDFSRHGNAKYGAATHAAKRMRSKQGKMEKSFLTFVATYPTWKPPPAGRQLLSTISASAYGTAPPPLPLPPAQAGGAGAGDGFFGAPAAPPAAAAAGAGQGAGLEGSVLWQHHAAPGASAAGAGAGAAAGGSSSVWLGVPEPPPGLRHPNYGQPGPPHCQSSPQRPPPPPPPPPHPHHQADGMGAGLGGLGCSPPELGDSVVLAGDLFGPLSPAEQQHQHQHQQAGAQPPALHRPPPAPAAHGGSNSLLVSPQARPPPHLAARPAAGGRGHGHQQLQLQQQQQQHASLLAGAAPQQHQHHYQHLHQQQQQQQYSLLPPSQQLLHLFPSTLYPGGPSAMAGLPHVVQQHLPHALGHHHAAGAAPPPPHCSVTLGASVLAASAAGSDLLPANETEDLSSRIAASQSLLQSFYESRDVSVQLRQHNRAHARSVLLGNSGSAAAAAAAVAAMAAASASHSAVPGGEW